MAVAPIDLFRSYTDLYSKFDADGVPTHDALGALISKSLAKKLRKDWEKHEKAYNAGLK
jgi:cysteinyl-tRNA synthetase